MNDLIRKFAIDYVFDFIKNTSYDRVREVLGITDDERIKRMKKQVITLMGEEQRLQHFERKIDELVTNIFPKHQERYRIGK